MEAWQATPLGVLVSMDTYHTPSCRRPHAWQGNTRGAVSACVPDTQSQADRMTPLTGL